MRVIDLVNMLPDKPWDWAGLSRNPNITFADVLSAPDKPWDWDGLSCNLFKGESTTKIQRFFRKFRRRRASDTTVKFSKPFESGSESLVDIEHNFMNITNVEIGSDTIEFRDGIPAVTYSSLFLEIDASIIDTIELVTFEIKKVEVEWIRWIDTARIQLLKPLNCDAEVEGLIRKHPNYFMIIWNYRFNGDMCMLQYTY